MALGEFDSDWRCPYCKGWNRQTTRNTCAKEYCRKPVDAMNRVTRAQWRVKYEQGIVSRRTRMLEQELSESE